MMLDPIPPLDPILPHRSPELVPTTEADEHTANVARWLEREGFTNAATVLQLLIKRHQIVRLVDLKAAAASNVLATMLEASDAGDCHVRIWSFEHRAYWRDKGAGYTTYSLEAGIYRFREAWDKSRHCDASKGIAYEVMA